MKSKIQIKTERLQKMLDAENFGGVLINARHNFAWLTDGKSQSRSPRVSKSANLLVSALLLTRGLLPRFSFHIFNQTKAANQITTNS
ncbi:MAG: hypothetical protein ACR2GD_09955 [Pyrinomonadaceae bacterium]